MLLKRAFSVLTSIGSIAMMPKSATNPNFIFSAYKDITINMDWNKNVFRSASSGAMLPLSSSMPSNMEVITLAFATGECGRESWAGLTSSVVVENLKLLVAAGKKYRISTGGATGVFRCSSDANFLTFIKTYYSANLLGIDFDIESGQTAMDLENLAMRVKYAQSLYPNLRFSFTLATLGSSSASLNSLGAATISAIKKAGLKNYYINLMTMNFGGPSEHVCVMDKSSHTCNMGISSIQAAFTVSDQYGIPLSQIELTPMIGGNDVLSEIFSLEDVDVVTSFAVNNGLAGINYWSFDRDVDCGRGSASPTCNSYGKSAGYQGFLNRFLSSLNVGSSHSNSHSSENTNNNSENDNSENDNIENSNSENSNNAGNQCSSSSDAPSVPTGPTTMGSPCSCLNFGAWSSDYSSVCSYIQADPPICAFIQMFYEEMTPPSVFQDTESKSQ